MKVKDALKAKARQIRYLLLDVDGVLTNGLLTFDEAGREIKSFSIYDGLGINLLHQAGIGVGIISGRNSPVVARRAAELQIVDVFQGCSDKLGPYSEIKSKRALIDDSVAFIGDDLIDLPVLDKVGLAVAVANAVDTVKAHVDWITERKGGDGAVREVIDFILKSQKHDEKYEVV